MAIRQYVVDAFTDRPFSGNPAAICLLDRSDQPWPASEWLQAVAAENQLSETAFVRPRDLGSFDLRWFTPTTEVDLCGHATLAAAHVLYRHYGHEEARLHFFTRSGELVVSRRDPWLDLDLPASPPQPLRCPPLLAEALGRAPLQVLGAEDYLAVFERPEDILALQPDMALLAGLDRRGVIVTAPASEVDFVSRFFAPRLGVPEDPVTGSAHCQLVPYWADRLGRPHLHARQLSARGGELRGHWLGRRVLLSGQAVTTLQGDWLIAPF